MSCHKCRTNKCIRVLKAFVDGVPVFAHHEDVEGEVNGVTVFTLQRLDFSVFQVELQPQCYTLCSDLSCNLVQRLVIDYLCNNVFGHKCVAID